MLKTILETRVDYFKYFLREKKRKRKLTNSFLKEQNLYFMIK